MIENEITVQTERRGVNQLGVPDSESGYSTISSGRDSGVADV